ncbi:MAG: hypothetical protein WCD08_08805 [Steroidobacteraceae bacterium]
MKTLRWAIFTLLAASSLSGCGGGSAAVQPPAPAAVTGVDTPRSVAVVTAN